MTEHEFDDSIRDALTAYRGPPPPPLERMWVDIEARVFDAPARPEWPRVLAYAATLLLGVGIGWGGTRLLTSPGPVPAATPAAAAGPSSPSPFVGVASDYLEQTTALIVAVSGDTVAALSSATMTRARDLLSTTRLLLDAGVSNPVLRDLLQDLELVLAQVVRLPEARAAGSDPTRFVTEAVAQHEVLPRLTLMLADVRGTQ